MKQYSDSELDKLVKEVVQKMVESATPPPLEESWARFEKKLREHKPPITKKKDFLFLAAAAGVIILIVGTLTISFPVKARALCEKIVNTVETLVGSTQMNIKTDYKDSEPGRLPPPPDDFKEVPIGQEQTISLEEVKLVSPFTVSIPEYIPADYKLEQVKFQEMAKPVAKVTIKYNGPYSNYFLISEMNAPDGSVQGYGYDIEDAIVQDLNVGDKNGKIILFKNEKIRATWLQHSMMYGLEGKISREEALKIIESMH